MKQHICDQLGKLGTCTLCFLLATSSLGDGSHLALKSTHAIAERTISPGSGDHYEAVKSKLPYGFLIRGWGPAEPGHDETPETWSRTTSPARPEYMISAGQPPTLSDSDHLKVRLPTRNG